jgi:hypothetical protein
MVRNICTVRGAGDAARTVQIVTTPRVKQRQALELLAAIRV